MVALFSQETMLRNRIARSPWYAYSSIPGLWKESDLYMFKRGVAQDESVFPRLQNLVQPSPIRLHANACKYRRGSFALLIILLS